MNDLEEHDHQLSAFFEEAKTDLSSTDFTQRIMLDLRRQNHRDIFIWVLCYIVALAFMWVFAPYIVRASQVIAYLPSDTMEFLTENLQPLSTLSLSYLLALPILAYALFSKYGNT